MRRRYICKTAKELVPGDVFIPDHLLRSWLEENTGEAGWTVKSHTLTQRGDYSTIVMVEHQNTSWSERFDPEEKVWLFPREERTV